MGIRKIEDEIDLKEAMKKKAAELQIKDMQAKASVEKFTKDRLRELAKKHGPAAIKRLVTLMSSDNERTAVAACDAILNRGYGRPAQSVTLAGEEDGPPVQLEGVVRFVRPD